MNNIVLLIVDKLLELASYSYTSLTHMHPHVLPHATGVRWLVSEHANDVERERVKVGKTDFK
jgi:hypothetical protein